MSDVPYGWIALALVLVFLLGIFLGFDGGEDYVFHQAEIGNAYKHRGVIIDLKVRP